MSRASVIIAILGIGTAGCGDCLSYAGGAILVDVIDAKTGAPIAGGATLVARGPGGADSLTFPADEVRRTMTIFDAYLEPGWYLVEVRRAGYAPWSRNEVLLLPKDDCGHLRPVHLTARLQPL